MDFLSRFGFWTVLALMCVAALGLQFFLVRPMARSNVELWTELKGRIGKLEEFAKPGMPLKNKEWIKYENKRAKIWDAQKSRCERYFKSMPSFPSVLTVDGVPIASNARSAWCQEFREQARKRLGEIADAGVDIGPKTFKFQIEAETYKQRYPVPSEIPFLTREFFIQQEFIKALCDKRIELAEIDSLKIGKEAEDVTEALEEVEQKGLYETEPYCLVVWLEFSRIQHLFRSLLSSPRLMLSIERLAVEQIRGGNPKHPNAVRITIVGRYMNFAAAREGGQG